MDRQWIEVLLVSSDEGLADMISSHVESTLDARVTHVQTRADAVSACPQHKPDIVVADMELPDGDGLALARQLPQACEDDPAILLMSEQPTVGRAIEAMRLGVRDLFTKPFDVRRLAHVIEQEAGSLQVRRRQALRTRRLRRLSGQVIRERRDLRRRVDLVCRDLVFAYQRLARKVTEGDLSTYDE